MQIEYVHSDNSVRLIRIQFSSFIGMMTGELDNFQVHIRGTEQWRPF